MYDSDGHPNPAQAGVSKLRILFDVTFCENFPKFTQLQADLRNLQGVCNKFVFIFIFFFFFFFKWLGDREMQFRRFPRGYLLFSELLNSKIWGSRADELFFF
jgi:hypothetical protein